MAADVQTEEVRQECDWLSVALSTAWAICDHRAANLLASWESLPGALPLLLNKDTMAKGLQFCKKLAQVFVAASKRQEPHILAMVKRSWLNTAGGHHIMQHLSWSDFKTGVKGGLRLCQHIFCYWADTIARETLLWPEAS